jgi:hypothetical protein
LNNPAQLLNEHLMVCEQAYSDDFHSGVISIYHLGQHVPQHGKGKKED